MDGELKENKGMGLQVRAILVFISSLLVLIAASFLGARNMEFARILCYGVAIAISGYSMALEGFSKLLDKKFSHQLVALIAILAIFTWWGHQEAALLTIIYSFGLMAEEVVRERVNQHLSEKTKDGSKTVLVLEDGELAERGLGEVYLGDFIYVNDGDEIQFDGFAASGTDEESMERAEYMPVGTIYHGEAAYLKVSHIETDDLIAKNAEKEENKSRVQVLIEMFSKFFMILIIIGGAIFTGVSLLLGTPLREAIFRGGIFWLLSGPGAFLMSLPLSTAVAKESSAAAGAKAPKTVALEVLARIKRVYFDKTGVITAGNYQVGEITPAGGFSEDQVLRIAALAEAKSNHPIAKAIREAAGTDYNPNFLGDEYPGYGVAFLHDEKTIRCGSKQFMSENEIDISGLPDTTVYVAIDSGVIGSIKMNDTLYGKSIKTILALQESKVDSVLVTCDNATTAEAIGRKCGMTESYGWLSADQKDDKLIEGKQKGKIAYVPSYNSVEPLLSTADVTVIVTPEQRSSAPSEELALDEVAALPAVVRIAKKFFTVVYANFIVAIFIKVALLALAFAFNTSWPLLLVDMLLGIITMLTAGYAISGDKPEEV